MACPNWKSAVPGRRKRFFYYVLAELHNHEMRVRLHIILDTDSDESKHATVQPTGFCIIEFASLSLHL